MIINSHLRVVALLLKLLHRLHDHIAHPAVGEDRAVGSGADQLGLLQGLILIRAARLSLDVIKEDVLEENDRIVTANGLRWGSKSW